MFSLERLFLFVFFDIYSVDDDDDDDDSLESNSSISSCVNWRVAGAQNTCPVNGVVENVHPAQFDDAMNAACCSTAFNK